MPNNLILKKHKKHKKHKQYHHGNLREALIEASMQMLQFQGKEALGLRGLARILNVSQTAPYSHFKNKAELLAATAEVGFRNLAINMLDSIKKGSPPIEKIESFAICYVRFAIKNKELFALMFSREFNDMKNHPTLLMTASKSYSLFSAAVSEFKNDKTKELTDIIWCFVHGTASLAADGKLAIEDKNLEEFVKSRLSLIVK